jgi:IS6 family transposase
MARQRRVASVRRDPAFKGRQFTAEVILWAVRWYLMFPISYRDLELMLLGRGVAVDHTTVFGGSKLTPSSLKSGSGRTCA